MAYLGRKRTHVVFGDSRTSDDLYREIQKFNLNRTPFNIEQYKGAGLIEVVEKADLYLHSYPFDVAYIIAGVNDITNKNKVTGRIDFLWKTEESLTHYLISTRETCYRQLKGDHPAAGIVFCPLIGLDLGRVVPSSSSAQQEIIDNSVWASNIELHKMKDKYNFYFPYLTSPIHRIENGKHKSYYHHLCTDGLHLTDALNRTWAKQIVKAFDRN